MGVTVLGDAFVDIIVPIHNVKRGETYHRNITVVCGGTANVAIQISKLGEQAKFIGKVGNDAFGKYFKEELVKSRVRDLTFIDNKHPTGLCLSLIHSDGDRSMIAARGANGYLTKEEIESRVKELLKSRIVYYSGYSLLSKVTLEGILYAMKKCHKYDCQIWFNPGAPNLIMEDFRSLIHGFVDVLILNLEEAKSLTGKGEIDDILAELDKVVDIAVVTQGKEGCIVSRSGQHIRVKAEALDFVTDTTGAGDAFSAGIIVGRLRDMNFMDSARLGHKTAANLLRERVRMTS